MKVLHLPVLLLQHPLHRAEHLEVYGTGHTPPSTVALCSRTPYLE